MIPRTIYRHTFQSFSPKEPPDDIQVTTDIFDMDNLIPDDEAQEVIDLIPSGDPYNLAIIDNSEDPLTVIKGLQLTLRFNSTQTENMSTFASGSDSRWYVHSYINSSLRTVLKGYLVLSNLREDFMCLPNIVTLIATDNLGSLKDVPLKDFNDLNPTGYNRIADYLAWCLNPTGLALQLKAAFNIRRRPKVFVTTIGWQFVAADKRIITEPTDFFYAGQILTVTGTGSNDGTYTVTGAGTVLVTTAFVLETLVDEAGVTPITFTDTASGHFFDNIYLDAKTFEDEIGTCVNCAAVIEKILGEEACIFQRNGFWWVLRIDEIEDLTRGLFISLFNADGTFNSVLGEKHFDKEIEKTTDDSKIFFSKELTQVVVDRPVESVKLSYPYEVPLEVPCNVDFSRGEVIDDTDPDEKTYKAECWPLKRLFDQPVSSTAFIKKLFVNDQETERYLVITPASNAATPWNYVESEPIPVGKNDKVIVNLDFRFASDIGGGGGITYYPLRVYLKDDNGDYWYWWHPSSTDLEDFYWTGPVGPEAERSIPKNWNLSDQNETQWMTLNVAMAALPASGRLYIGINQMNQDAGAGDNVDAYFNLSVEILSYIAGSYQRYTGQSNEVAQSGGYKPKRDKQIYVSDSPRPIFKGAFLEFSTWSEIWNDTTDFFVTINTFQIAGNKIAVFRPGMRIRIRGTASNNIETKIISSSYVLIGDLTSVAVEGTLANENVTAIIEDALYKLAGLFYNDAVTPTPPSHTYGEIQIFDVWNQFRNCMRVFQAVCQGLDLQMTDADGKNYNASLINKWTLADVTENTIDRIFFLLTFNQNFQVAEWTGTIREVWNFSEQKNYENRTFKFLT